MWSCSGILQETKEKTKVCVTHVLIPLMWSPWDPSAFRNNISLYFIFSVLRSISTYRVLLNYFFFFVFIFFFCLFFYMLYVISIRANMIWKELFNQRCPALSDFILSPMLYRTINWKSLELSFYYLFILYLSRKVLLRCTFPFDRKSWPNSTSSCTQKRILHCFISYS